MKKSITLAALSLSAAIIPTSVLALENEVSTNETKETSYVCKKAEEYTEEEIKNGVEVCTEAVLPKETLEEVFNSKEEATKKAKELEKDTKEETVEATVREEEVIVGKDETSASETFLTNEEASNYVEEKSAELKKEGYTIDSTDITVVSKDVDLKDEVTKTFSSKEEADAYIQDLISKGYVLTDTESVLSDVVYKDVNVNYGSNNATIKDSNRANLYIRLDGIVQYENGSTGYEKEKYVYAGEVAVTKSKVYDINAHNHNDDLEYLVKNNNSIGEVIEKTATRDSIKAQLANYGIELKDNQVIVWYVLKTTSDSAGQKMTYKNEKTGKTVTVTLKAAKYHIDGVIRDKEVLEEIYKVEGVGTKPTYKATVNASKDKIVKNYYVDTVTTVRSYENIFGQGENEEEEEEIVNTGAEVDGSVVTASVSTLALAVVAVATSKNKKRK